MEIIKIIVSVWLPLLVWFAWSFFTINSVNTWYETLERPFFSPPNWVFWPVWTILYILIWLSFYIVWKNNFWKQKTKVKIIYFLQLFFNFTWSIAFFYLQSPFLWLINILILWILILLNIVFFYKVKKIAWYLLIPYFLWVSFASVLNYSIFILN